MPRPSENDKLSINDLARLKDVVARGIERFGSAKSFADKLGVRPPIVSLARHGRLVAKTEFTQRILDFEFPELAANVPADQALPPRLKEAPAYDHELMKAVAALAGQSKRRRRELLNMLHAAIKLTSS